MLLHSEWSVRTVISCNMMWCDVACFCQNMHSMVLVLGQDRTLRVFLHGMRLWDADLPSVSFHSFCYLYGCTALYSSLYERNVIDTTSSSILSPIQYGIEPSLQLILSLSVLSLSLLTGLRMVGGANDGSIHIWQERKVYSKPDLLIRLAHTVGSLVTSVLTSSTG
jgi:WD40 repeat protein